MCAGTLSRRQQRVQERLVLRLIERTVQIIVRAVERFSVARRAKRDRHVDRFGIHNRADAVVEKQAAGACDARDLLRPARPKSAARWR